MNFKAFLIVLILLCLSACGHLRSNSAKNSSTTVNQDNTVSTSNAPTPDLDDIPNSNNHLGNSQNHSGQTDGAPQIRILERTPLATAQPAPAIDILERMRRGFRLPELNSKYVEEYEVWDSRHPTYLKNLFARSEPFLYYIVNEIEKRGLPMELALLPAIESGYKPHAVSRSRAAGLWQFIPSTGRGFNLRQDSWYDGRHDVVASTQAALDYLTQLNTMFDGDWFLTLAAYNAGPGTVSRSIKANKRKRKKTGYSDLSLRSETRRYVPKLMALKNIINNPAKYNFELPNLVNEMHFEVINLSGQVDIHDFAKNANIDHKTLQHLNPGYKRWATPPQGPHRLLVPAASYDAAQAAKQLAAASPLQKVEYRNHTIKQGDNLGAIARRYGVSINALQTSNKLSGTNIRAGKNLVIPIRAGLTSTSVNSDTNSQSKLIHRVQRGDTLWSIARHYKVKLQQLVSWNNISKNQVLSLDQSLLVFVN